jgi:hypothetical protein
VIKLLVHMVTTVIKGLMVSKELCVNSGKDIKLIDMNILCMGKIMCF